MDKTDDNRHHLFVLRHGKASDGVIDRDFERLLNNTGIEQAEKIADWLIYHNIQPDIVLTSPAKRTLMTTEIVTKKLKIESQKVRIVSQIYQANLNTLLKAIASCPTQHRTLLLIAHNPGLEDLVDYLLSPSLTNTLENDYRIFPATLIKLELDVDWFHLEKSCAQSVAITHGKFLP